MPPDVTDAYQVFEALDAGVTLGLHEFLGLPAMLGDDLRMIYGAAEQMRDKAAAENQARMLRAMGRG